MDIDKLNKEIISALDTDGLAQSYLADTTSTKYAWWSKDTLGFIQIDQRIYVPLSGDLCLRVLRTYHDHPLQTFRYQQDSGFNPLRVYLARNLYIGYCYSGDS